MEILIILPIIIALYWVYRINDNKSNNRGGITKVDDKHFIINNEWVSLDDNDDLHKMRQEMEDDRKFNEYKRWKFMEDFKSVNNEYFNVKMHPMYNKLLNEVTNKDIEESKDRYEYYLKKCKCLPYDTPLTKEEFAMKEKTIGMMDFSFQMYFDREGYTIHSFDNAKYSGDYTVQKEFKEKYY